MTLSRTVRTITIDREFGAGGQEVADRLASALGWQLVDRRAAHASFVAAGFTLTAVGDDEKPLSWSERLASTFWLGTPHSGVNPRIGTSAIGLMRAQTRALVEAAAKGDPSIILGRGAAYILGHRPDLFHVFIYGSPTLKRGRLIRAGFTQTEADSALQKRDHERRLYVKQTFGHPWPQLDVYNLLISSDSGIDSLVQVILFMAQRA